MSIVWYEGEGVVCEEHGTRQETFSRDSFEAVVDLRCAWSDRMALMSFLVGQRSAYPDWPLARVVSAVARPFPSKATTSGDMLVYEDAIISVKYSTNEEEQLFSETIEPAVEFMTQDHRMFRWDDALGDPLSPNEAPGKRQFSLMLSRTLYKVAPPLPTGLLTLVGTCNLNPYTSSSLGLTFAAETLLFVPSSISRTVTTDMDSRAFDVTVKFPFKADTWNKFWRSKTEDYEEIFNLDTNAVHKSYPPANYAAFLF